MSPPPSESATAVAPGPPQGTGPSFGDGWQAAAPRLILPTSPWAVAAALVLVQFALAQLSLLVSGLSPSSSTVWLPSALTYAAAVVLGWQALPGLFLGQLLFALLAGEASAATALLLACGDVASASAVVAALQLARHRSHLLAPRREGVAGAARAVSFEGDVMARPRLFMLSVLAFAAGAFGNASFGILAFHPPGASTAAGAWAFMREWAMADLAAGLLAGPLLLRLMRFEKSEWCGDCARFVATSLAILVSLGVLFESLNRVPVPYVTALVMPALLWAALRCTLAQAALFNLVLGALVVAHADGALRPPAAQTKEQALMLTQVYLGAMVASALVVAVTRVQLLAAKAQLERAKAALELGESMARTGTFRAPMAQSTHEWSPQLRALLALRPDEPPSAEAFFARIHPEDRPAVVAAWAESQRTGAPFDTRYRLMLGDRVRWARTVGRFEFDEYGAPHTAWGSVQDISDEVALQEAKAARTRADAANQAKSAFLATLSHEIRTPLNGVIGLSELAREDGVDETARREYLHQLGESAKLLNTIISDVLDLSKIESGRMEVERVPFELREVLQILHSSYRTLGHAKGLEVRLELPPGMPGTVVGDPTRVQQVLNNFLSNALKFTAHGHITLRVRAEGEALRFEVQDTGIGLAAGQVEQLFQPFTQADVSDTRRYGGTGLGLAICRELARLMGGTVGAQGEPGHGSTFWLRLPLPAGEAEPTKPARPPEPLSGLEGLHLLLAEDNRVNALVATRLLERAGARVQWVQSGAAALSAVQATWDGQEDATPFDAVLMDVHMPELDGLEATRQVRAFEAERPGLGRLPIIAMTAGVLTEQQQAARDAGMDGFIPKPLDRRALISTLAEVLRARQTA